MTDYYALLGVAHTASGEEIRRAWKKMARRYHPDVSDHPEAAREFLLRKTAYDVLSDPNKRARYDREHDRAGAKASRSDRTQEKRGSWTPVDSLIFSWVIMGEDGWPFLDRKGLAGYVGNDPPSVNQLVRERCVTTSSKRESWPLMQTEEISSVWPENGSKPERFSLGNLPRILEEAGGDPEICLSPGGSRDPGPILAGDGPGSRVLRQRLRAHDPSGGTGDPAGPMWSPLSGRTVVPRRLRAGLAALPSLLCPGDV